MESILDYIRRLFSWTEDTRKRRATDDLDFFTSPKLRKIGGMSNLYDDVKARGAIKRQSLTPRNTKPLIKETIVIDDDEPKCLSSGKSRTYTSTPADRFNPKKRFTPSNDDVTFVKDIKTSTEKRAAALKRGFDYIRPMATPKTSFDRGKKLDRSASNMGNVIHLNGFDTKKTSPTLNFVNQLEDKRDYQTLLNAHLSAYNSPNISIYETPLSRLSKYFSFEETPSSMSRSKRILDLAHASSKKKSVIDLTKGESKVNGHSTNRRLSTRDTIKKIVLDTPEETVDVDDSESDVEVLPTPPSPKPDIRVEPVNSLKCILDTSCSTKKDWLNKLVGDHKKLIEDRENEVKALQKQCDHMNKINKDIRIGTLANKVDKCLHIKESVLEITEETEEEELPELTNDHLMVINKAFTGGSHREVLISKFSLNLTRKDILTLSGLNWLNDEVINFYMNLIMERSKNNEKYPKTYAFNTFFYPKLIKDGPESLRRWTRRVDLFAHDLICIPIHLGVHWCMAIVDFRDRSIRYYDSMGSSNNKCLEALRRYLEAEHYDKKKEAYDTSDFILENMKDIPQQMNGSDCGMFSCTFAEYISRNAKITFKQENMPYFRNKMVYEIIMGELMIQ